MRLSLVAKLRRHCAIVAALLVAVLAALPAHAQATAQPAKPAAPKTTGAAAAPAKSPATGAAQQSTPARGAKPASTGNPLSPTEPIKPNRVFIDINHATLKELKAIPGIGDVYGKKIIAGRPYANKSQLVSRKIIDAGLYETIQGMIIAKQ